LQRGEVVDRWPVDNYEEVVERDRVDVRRSRKSICFVNVKIIGRDLLGR